jgi:hypothetical protein
MLLAYIELFPSLRTRSCHRLAACTPKACGTFRLAMFALLGRLLCRFMYIATNPSFFVLFSGSSVAYSVSAVVSGLFPLADLLHALAPTVPNW